MFRKTALAVIGACAVALGCGKAGTTPAETVVVQPVAPPPPLAVAPSTATAVPEEDAPGTCEGVRLEIKAVADQGYTRFEGMLFNGGKKKVTLVEPGDGSDVGWRTPVITWKATTLAGMAAPREEHGRCGNVNAIQEKEVFDLRPGERRAVGEWLGAPDVKPGRYLVRVVYENDPKHDLTGISLGPSSDKALAKIRKSTPCRIESAAIIADITSP